MFIINNLFLVGDTVVATSPVNCADQGNAFQNTENNN